MATPSMYAECAHISRQKPIIAVSNELKQKILAEYDTLPSYEAIIYSYINTKQYSLKRNAILKCRWETYIQNVAGRIYSPFLFPDSRHQHFHNCNIRYLPNETFRLDNRMKLKVGPGVDFRGQMPIPNELLMKRGGERDIKEDTKENKKKVTKKQKKRKIKEGV